MCNVRKKSNHLAIRTKFRLRSLSKNGTRSKNKVVRNVDFASLARGVLNFAVRRSWWHDVMYVLKSSAISPRCQISPYGRDGLYFRSRWQVKGYSGPFSDVTTGDDFYHLIHARTSWIRFSERTFKQYYELIIYLNNVINNF